MSNRFILAAAAAALLTGCAGKPYVAAQAGATIWPDRSNQDELEADAAPGWTAGMAGGIQFDWGRAEAELSHRVSPIHGENGHGLEASADGHDLQATAFMLNVWPEYQLSDWASLFIGGGAGGAFLQAVDETAVAPAAQLGAGVKFKPWDNVFVEVGYRYFLTAETEIAGRDATYDAHGPMLRVGVTFGSGRSFIDDLSYRSDYEPLEAE